MQSYSVQDDTVSLTGDAVEVKRDPVSFSPITNQENQKENKMDKKELIDSLIANEAIQFGEDDRAVLDAMDESTLQKMLPKVNTTDEESEEEEDTPKKTEKKEEAPKANAEAQIPLSKVEEMIQSAIAANAAVTQKAPLVEGLVANSKCSLKRETLQNMDIEELQELTSTYTPHEYAGRGGFEQQQVSNSEEVMDLPDYDAKK
jgi:hypothetical protein